MEIKENLFLTIYTVMQKAQTKLFQPRRARRGAVNRSWPAFVFFVVR